VLEHEALRNLSNDELHLDVRHRRADTVAVASGEWNEREALMLGDCLRRKSIGIESIRVRPQRR
jgi:hypothetical protein